MDRCSKGEPHAGGWRAEGAGLLAAAEGAPGRTGLRPYPGPGAVGGAAAEAGVGTPGWPSHGVLGHLSSQLRGRTLPRLATRTCRAPLEAGASATPTAQQPRHRAALARLPLLSGGGWHLKHRRPPPTAPPPRRSLSEHMSRARQDTRVAHACGSPVIKPGSFPPHTTAGRHRLRRRESATCSLATQVCPPPRHELHRTSQLHVKCKARACVRA